ncbi:zf-HC2 domain-containing protein [Lacrimispora sp.]|uniref:zf-HC2 domain-containing protein n=1 Tax=Lacrimispora sp. TaxID=2719234 RepID=UPI0032E4798E
MKCSIVKDLLSNYIDGLTSEETDAEIRKHLDNCRECRTLYEEMSVVIFKEIPTEDKDIDFLKKLKAKILHKNIMVALLTCTILLCGLIIFAKYYELPLPFDSNRMFVELCPSVVVTNKDGRTMWKKLKPSDAGATGQKDSGDVINVVERVYRGISQITENSSGRDVNRNGEKVRVVYYCYAKTLWTSLFFDYDLAAYSESGSSTGSDIYGDGYESTDYKPQMIEIYYLPVRNLHKLDDLTDEEFDGLKEKGTLVWSGVN